MLDVRYELITEWLVIHEDLERHRSGSETLLIRESGKRSANSHIGIMVFPVEAVLTG